MTDTTWRNRMTRTIKLVPPGDLVANPMNPRRHSTLQREGLRAALDALGWIAPVTVNSTTGNLVDGHARVEEALTAGLDSVPVMYVTLSEEQERLALATLDPIAALAHYDADALEALTGSLDLEALDGVLIALINDVPNVWSVLAGAELEAFNNGDATFGNGAATLDDVINGNGNGPDTGRLLDLYDVTIVEPTTQVAEGNVWRIGQSVLAVCDVMNGWPTWTPLLTDGSLFVPYPGPTVLMAGRVMERRLVMVQPVHYIAASMIDRALVMFEGHVEQLS